MLIRNDQERQEHGLTPFSYLCGYCSNDLTYPIVIGQDRRTTAYHAKCAAELATDLVTDLIELVGPLQEQLSPMTEAFRRAAQGGTEQ